MYGRLRGRGRCDHLRGRTAHGFTGADPGSEENKDRAHRVLCPGGAADSEAVGSPLSPDGGFPRSGRATGRGHLGFSREQLEHLEEYDFDEELRKIMACKREYEEKYGTAIPVIAAGGIFDYKDVTHALSLGVDGVQIASRFVATKECDASEAYKQAYIRAEEKDIAIIQSPVGMPGRALRNAFIRRWRRRRRPSANATTA